MYWLIFALIMTIGGVVASVNKKWNSGGYFISGLVNFSVAFIISYFDLNNMFLFYSGTFIFLCIFMLINSIATTSIIGDFPMGGYSSVVIIGLSLFILVSGSPFYGPEKYSDSIAKVRSCGSLPSPYVESYEKLKESFIKYSKENLPDGMQEYEFRALLVSISQMETQVGTVLAGLTRSDPGTDWLMGYTAGKAYPDKYRGVDKQLELSSDLIKRSLDNSLGSYSSCANLVGDEKLRRFLAIYNGGPGNPNYVYADNILRFMKGWEAYLSEDIESGTIAKKDSNTYAFSNLRLKGISK